MSIPSNQPPLEISDTSNQPQQDSSEETISQYNLPCGDLLMGGGRDYNKICIPLRNALMRGDWEEAEEILDDNRESWDLLEYSISFLKQTPLHIAAMSTSIKIVKNLVERMTEQQLVFQDDKGFTALHRVAIAGNVDMARAMVGKCPQLLTICCDSMLPIDLAARSGKHNMVAYLYDKHKSIARNDWTCVNAHLLFLGCIHGDLFDCALQILDDNNQIEFPVEDCAREILHLFARKPYAFNDTKSLKITWTRLAKRKSVATILLRKIWKNILERSSKEVLDILKGPAELVGDKEGTYPFHMIFDAAKLGNTKFLVELIREYPDITFLRNDDKHTIFDIAISHRYESIYNLLYEMGPVHDYLSVFQDRHGNNMLHLAGMKAKSPLKDVSGAAFQMQRELLWFEEVKSKLPANCREKRNHADRTPLQLFIVDHQDMVSEGEKWMKETANQCMVVAALITTVVFAAAFTFPGGYNQNNGLPIFLKDGPFIGFIIFDAISLILSSASILMFLSILTSRYAHEDFRISLPRKLMIGLTTLFLSIITMMVVFTISFFVLYRTKLITIPIIISVVAVAPVVLYMILQFPLLVDVYRSTYGNKYLFRPKKRVLFYRNPRF